MIKLVCANWKRIFGFDVVVRTIWMAKENAHLTMVVIDTGPICRQRQKATKKNKNRSRKWLNEDETRQRLSNYPQRWIGLEQQKAGSGKRKQSRRKVQKEAEIVLMATKKAKNRNWYETMHKPWTTEDDHRHFSMDALCDASASESRN